MIHSLLAVCLLAMGVGAKASTPIELNRQETPNKLNQKSNIQYRNENREGEQTSTYNLPTTQTPIGIWKDGTRVANYKIKYQQEQNDAIAVQTIITGEQSYDQYGYEIVGTALDQYEQYKRENCSLIQYKITPYLSTLDNTLSLNIVTRINNVYLYDYDNGWTGAATNRQIVATTELIYGTTKRLEQGYDLINWDTKGVCWDTFQGLKENLYTESYETKYTAVTTWTNQQQLISTNFDIVIPKNQNYDVTYVYALTYLQTFHEDGQTDTVEIKITDEALANNDPIIQFYAGGGISGTQINVTINYEVIDIPGLMWEILSMPFAFISTAFNLTLFRGTPYQLNISNLFMMIFGVLVFIFILKMLIKK